MGRIKNEGDEFFLEDCIGHQLTDEAGAGVVLKKGPWTSAEDAILVEYVTKHGEGNWNAVQKNSGLLRCGKSCRLRWANHLRPNLKKGAFSPEEERLIAELHAKMGNKWARMAAHLPGRTDNEIKNYWNTRIKRRQRAGLPLYPPEMSLQALQESQQGQTSDGIYHGERGDYDLQKISYEIPEVVFESMKANEHILPYVPIIPDISTNAFLLKDLDSSQYCDFLPSTFHCPKRLRGSTVSYFDSCGGIENEFSLSQHFQDYTCDKAPPSFEFHSPIDPDPTSENSLSFSHSISNGISSASEPSSEAVKLELPSLQYPETDLGSWGTSSPPPILEPIDAFIQSPPPPLCMQESDCSSPRNSGLLDALLDQAKFLTGVKNQSSDKSSNSSTATPGDIADISTLNMCETEWEDYANPISPIGHSATSLLSECIPFSASGSSMDEQLPAETFHGDNVKEEPGDIVKVEPENPDSLLDREKQTISPLGISCPDILLASDWLEQNSRCNKNQVLMTDAIATLLGDDLATNYTNMVDETSISVQGRGLGFCWWSNRSATCLTDLP